MHNAPPVVFPVGRFPWGWALGWSAAAVSAVGLLAWQWLTQADGLWVACVGGGWLICVLGAAFWAPRQMWATGELVWTGEAWFWQAQPLEAGPLQPLSVSVGLDTGHGLLLWVRRLDARTLKPGPWCSAWCHADTMPTKWHGFRCAVYSRPKEHQASQRTVSDPH